jgi:23S rRNA (cytosine1962-C5)-methyltransferase
MMQLAPRLKQLVSQPQQARRLLHGRGGTYAGWQHLNIDYYAGVVMLTWFAATDAEQAVLQAVLDTAESIPDSHIINGVASQYRYIKPATTQVLWGEVPQRLAVCEGELQFWVDMRRQNSGLFLDMAPGRQWLLKHAQHKRVLNTFAFTCSLSVAAVAGGASRVVNIDMNGGVLKRGRENHMLNGQQSAAVDYLPYQVLKSIGKLARKGPFDLIIVDPPTFQAGSFEFDKDYGRLLRRLPRLIGGQATLLLCCNSPGVSLDKFQALINEHLPSARFMQRLSHSKDFVEQAEAPLKALVYDYQADLVCAQG